ncbi:hypothetical protein ACHAP5_006744 [Fusarium lateritium]
MKTQEKQVSTAINCTRGNSKQDDKGRRYCNVDVYKMGIPVETFTDAKLLEPLPFLENVRDKACRSSGLCDFNETVIIPFSLNKTHSRVPENSTGYFGFTPEWLCMSGTVKNCEGDDENRDGLAITVCGYRILSKGKNKTDRSDDVFAGITRFVETTDDEFEEMLNERPWPSYEDAIKDKEEEEESEAIRSTSLYTVGNVFWSLVAVLFLSL